MSLLIIPFAYSHVQHYRRRHLTEADAAPPIASEAPQTQRNIRGLNFSNLVAIVLISLLNTVSFKQVKLLSANFNFGC